MIHRGRHILLGAVTALFGIFLFTQRLNAGDETSSNPVLHTNDVLQTLSDIRLEDQFGEAHDYTFPSARPMVLLVADKKGNDALADWIAGLRTPLAGQIPMVGVADVRGVPGLFQGRVKRKFREAQKHPVLMDWEGTVLEFLEPAKGIPNVYLVNPKGEVVLHLSGAMTKRKLDELRTQLNSIDTNESDRRR